MESMNETYGRDIDLNLLRVFAVVAESGSVTAAAGRLYLTQPAVSAALRRLHTAVGAPLFARRGRGLALTSRGERLFAQTHAHLRALVDAALAPPRFDPRSNDRTFRLGLADAAESWLLPALLRVLAEQAPRMRIIAVPVQFRSVGLALSTGAIETAVTVADELPAGIRRQKLFTGGFVCLFDPRHARIERRLGKADYFAHDHVVVSYNGDLRGIVEDLLARQRRVRCSVSSFANLGALVDGTPLLATVPALVARTIRAVRPHLDTRPLPFPLRGAYTELLWPAATDDDDPARFLRAHITQIAATTQTAGSG
jgi:LysR family transcriptional regulator, mexEF-oprN operon transcriptional activator